MVLPRVERASQNQVPLPRLRVWILPEPIQFRCTNPAHPMLNMTQPLTAGTHPEAVRRGYSNNVSS
jgi:hypothetical protein